MSYGSSGGLNTLLFTIQNVSIKFHQDFPEQNFPSHLQYKMFLLNKLDSVLAVVFLFHLQYKMFLLNLSIL